jgi:hypothetical protein
MRHNQQLDKLTIIVSLRLELGLGRVQRTDVTRVLERCVGDDAAEVIKRAARRSS